MTRFLQSLKHKGTRAGVIAATIATIAAAVSFFPNSAGAAVVQDPNKGFNNSTVLGDTSSGWFGPYGIAYQGQALDGFCIDHGNEIMPDDTYTWTPLDASKGLNNFQGAPVSKQNLAAISWAVGYFSNSTANGVSAKVNNAAVELVEQSFMGGPYGTTNAPLNIDALQASDLTSHGDDSFGADAAAVVSQAKYIKAFALKYSNLQSGPTLDNAYNIDIAISPTNPGPNDIVTVTATLTDAKGNPVPQINIGAKIASGGTLVASETVQKQTGDHGRATWNFKNDAGDHSTTIGVTTLGDKLPLSTPLLYQSNVVKQDAQGKPLRAQRVAVAQYAVANATKTFGTVGGRQIAVHKDGDNEAYNPDMKGAIFTVYDADGNIKGTTTTKSNGDSDNPVSVPAGKGYTVKETKAPDSGAYTKDPAVKGPFDLTAKQPNGPLVVNFTDSVIPGSLTLTKADSKDKTKILGGAKFTLGFDKNNDGKYIIINPSIVTVAGQPTTIKNLNPGKYQLTEVSPPPGYSIDQKVTGPIVVATGKDTPVTITDSFQTESISGIKTDDTGKTPLQGAVIDLYRQGAVDNAPDSSNLNPAPAKFDGWTWVARQTSDKNGKFDFGQRTVGQTFAYAEAVAPAGYVISNPGLQSQTVLQLGSPIVFQVKDKPYGHIIGNKFDDNTKAPLQGATFDLYRQLNDGETATAPDSQPDDAATYDGYVWVTRSDPSDANGKIDFGAVAPGSTYCALEAQVPNAGYVKDTTFRCTDGPMGTDTVTLDLPNTAVTLVSAVQVTPQVKGESLAFTGGDWMKLGFYGLCLLMTGRLLMMVAARRRKKPRWMI